MVEFWKKILVLVTPYKGRFVMGLVCGLLSGVIAPLLPLAVKLTVDIVFSQNKDSGVTLDRDESNTIVYQATGTHPPGGNSVIHSEETTPADVTAKFGKLPDGLTRRLDKLVSSVDSKGLMIGAIAFIPFVMLLRGLLGYLNVYFLSWVAIRAVNDLRVRLFDHLIRLPVSFFTKSSTGELMERINYISILQNTIIHSVAVIIRDPISVIFLLGALLYQQTKLTLITLIVFPLCLVPIVVYGRKMRNIGSKLFGNFTFLGSVMHEAFTGHRIIKAYNLEDTSVERFRNTTQKYTAMFMRMVRATETPGPLIELFASIGVALFFVYAAFVVKTQTPGDLLQFVSSVFLMYQPVKALARLHGQLELTRSVTGQIYSLLDTPMEIQEPAVPKPIKAQNAPIVFENISFSYGDKKVLKNINLMIEPGTLVALVGSSGSGKTTLTNLLLRFYDPTEGVIRIGGTNIRDVLTKDLRNSIAVVTQETILFNDTIKSNIAVGKPNATDEEIIAAAKHAYAYDFILEKPQGFNTVVGEKGVALSGGQRQRIAIARAILKNAPILILDEATSALDTESERAVQAALDELMHGRTTIAVAHRLSTIQHADRIVVMSQGEIIEVATHDELVRQGGHYQRLYELQFQ